MSDVITLCLGQWPTMAKVKPKLVHIGVSGVACVEGLNASKAMVGTGSFEVCAALMAGHLDNLQLAVKHVHFCGDIRT